MNEENSLTEVEEKVPMISKLALGFADCMSTTLNSLITGGGMTYFFTKFLGLEENLASLVWIIFAIWNAVNDPLFGFISDKTKSKLGRRIPYIRYGSIIYAATFVITWFKWPIGQSQTALFIQMLATLFLFDTLYTAIATSLYVMPYCMAVSNKARSGIFLIKLPFTAVSLAIPLVVLPMIQPDVGEDPTMFQWIMVGIGVGAFLIIFFSTFLYKEKVQNESEEEIGIIKSVVACFKNKSFIIFEVLSFSVIFIQNILMQGVLYYFDEFDVPMYFAYGALAIGVIAGIVLWAIKHKSWGIRKCVIITCISFVAGASAMMIAGGNTVVAVIAFIVAGIGLAGGLYLVPMMNGDVIDYDEHKTGIRREGMYAGVNSLITKPALSFANAAFITIIGWFGYDSDLAKGAQSAMAEEGILIAWMAIPALLLIITAISMKWYPLHGEEWEKIKIEIEKKHND